MNEPNAIQRHPNATFVLSTTPLTTVLAWGIFKLGVSMPQAVAAAFGTLVSGGLLIFRSGIQRFGDAVWEHGLVGCCRRVWKGNQSPPAP